MDMLPLTQWSADAAARIHGVFTDIDDTLTTEGVITPDVIEALASLRAAGVQVIPITGRPIGWCEPWMAGRPGAALLPVDVMVAENGAVAFSRAVHEQAASRAGTGTGTAAAAASSSPGLVKRYQQDAATREAHQALLPRIAARVQAEVPGVELSRDSGGRETDIAFDYAEFAHHPPEVVDRVLRVLQDEGMRTTVSSIHIHGCFGDFDKWQGARWIVSELLQRDLTAELDRWVFVGDSGNDQPMFQHFVHSVGVANITHVAARLTHLPTYVTRQPRGAGFCEVAQAILAAR